MSSAYKTEKMSLSISDICKRSHMYFYFVLGLHTKFVIDQCNVQHNDQRTTSNRACAHCIVQKTNVLGTGWNCFRACIDINQYWKYNAVSARTTQFPSRGQSTSLPSVLHLFVDVKVRTVSTKSPRMNDKTHIGISLIFKSYVTELDGARRLHRPAALSNVGPINY